MNNKEMMAREKLLRAAHNVIGESILDRHPGPNDDASSEYAEENLIAAAREFVDKISDRQCATGSPYDASAPTRTRDITLNSSELDALRTGRTSINRDGVRVLYD
jgi:hypothetical protein